LGDWIAFNGATSEGSGICLTPIDLDSASPVGQTVLGMAEDDKGWGHYYFQPCWSPDGTQFASGVFQVDNRGDRVIDGSRKTDVVTGRQSDILTGSPLEYWRGNSIYTAP
jgi:hypothetical protein